MRLTHSLASALLLFSAGVAQAASTWGFDEGSVSVVAKKAGGTVKEKYAIHDTETLVIRS